MLRPIALFLAAFLLICGTTILLPGIDLWASGVFYRPGTGFFLADWGPLAAIHQGMRYLVAAAILAGIGLLLAALLGRPAPGIGWRAAVFLLISLAVGPGLMVNSLFKDHWGRARPAQIVNFGGTHRFSPAFVPSDQCRSNCSFPAGDPAVGFFFVSAGFLVAAPRRRRQAVTAALVFGALLGVMRIAQGGHFLSDVIASGFFVFAASWLLYRWILGGDGLTVLARQVRQPSPALRRFTLLGAVTAVAILISYRFLDRPLALAFQNDSPGVTRLFRFITAFGISTGWLLIALALAIGAAIAARRAGEPSSRRALSLVAWRAGFVFVAVAGAGLLGDILKPFFGRARPKLLFSHQIFGFTWHGGRADYWSFPSGHTITIVALAAALSLIHRRGLPLYAGAALVVVASRVVLAEHYLSDVLGGAYLAIVSVYAIQAGFRHAGVRFSDSP